MENAAKRPKNGKEAAKNRSAAVRAELATKRQNSRTAEVALIKNEVSVEIAAKRPALN